MFTILFNTHAFRPFYRLFDPGSSRSPSTRHIRLPRVLLALLLGVFPHLFNLASADTVLLYDFEDDNGAFDLSAEFIANGIDDRFVNLAPIFHGSLICVFPKGKSPP